jgi:hypothetical protein
MIHVKIKFSDFISKKRYVNLQLQFLHYCEKNGGPETLLQELKPDDFEIILKNKEQNKETYEAFKFKDLLTGKIEGLAYRTLVNLKKKISKINIVKEDELKRFIDKNLKNIDNYELAIRRNECLDKKVIGLLLEELNTVRSNLDSQEFEKGTILEKRIKLDWNQNDLLVLIALLRESGEISLDNSTAESGLAIDQIFAFKNSKTKEYQNYQGSGKKLNDIINGNTSIKKSINRLKDVFLSDDFYTTI